MSADRDNQGASGPPPEKAYRGAYAETTRKRVDLRDEAGDALPVEIVTCINVRTDPGLLEQLGAGTLNRFEHAEESPPVSVVVHAPHLELMVLVLPDDDPRRGIQQRIGFLRALAEEADGLPAYVFGHHVATAPFGPSELARLARATGSALATGRPARAAHSARRLLGEIESDADDAVTLRLPCDAERARRFVEGRTELLLQLHPLPTYPIIALVLVLLDASDRDLDELSCILDLADPAHLHILGVLQRGFAVTCHLVDGAGGRHASLPFERPLGGNAAYVLDRAASWLDRIPTGQRDRAAAETRFASEGYERIGAQRHNLHRDSFSELPNIGATRLAVSMVGYWSEAQNFDYLIQNRSFPLQWFRAIQRRVLRAGLRFGLFLPAELRACAVRQRMAGEESTLVARLVDTFAARVRAGDPYTELDPMALSENWDQLLTAAVELEVPVSDEVRELADRARRRARRGRDEVTGVAPPPPPPAPAPPRVQVSEASTQALRRLLAQGGIAPEASRELLGRGGETNIFMVIEAAPVLEEEEIETTARILAAGAEQFEPALLMGLGRPAPKIVHLCALALATARRVEALPALIELMHETERSAAIPIREIVARYGEAAIPAIFDAIEDRSATEALVEVLALISIDSAPAIISALRGYSSPSILEAAQRMSEARRRMGGRQLRATAIEHGEGKEK